MLVLASFRTAYEPKGSYPKSMHDPIRVVEDWRLGSTSIYAAGGYINSHFTAGEIIADYKVLNKLGPLLHSLQYEEVYPDEKTFASRERSLLVFNIAGIKYPSLVTPREAYVAAYDFGMTHNRVYDNSVVLMIAPNAD
jgi:hypothetical protein